MKRDGIKKHIIQEGSRKHVLYWDSRGVHCSEEDCEINERKNEDEKERH